MSGNENRCPPPPPWHVDPVSPEDHDRMEAIMRKRAEQTGESVTRAGTLRRIVRDTYRREVDPGGDQGA